MAKKLQKYNKKDHESRESSSKVTNFFLSHFFLLIHNPHSFQTFTIDPTTNGAISHANVQINTFLVTHLLKSALKSICQCISFNLNIGIVQMIQKKMYLTCFNGNH